MTKSVDIYGFLSDVIAFGRKQAEANKEKHDKERWKQLNLGNYEEAMTQAGLLSCDIGTMCTYDLFEKVIKYFQDHSDVNGWLKYEFNEKDFSFMAGEHGK